MEYPETFDAAREFADDALKSMEQHKIPATPRNFTVWYTYVSGKFPDLTSAVDQMVKDGEGFGDKENLELFERYFGHADEGIALHDASRKIRESVVEVLGFITDATEGASNFHDAMQENLGALGEQRGLEGIKSIVESIVSETKKIQEHNKSLEEKLKNSSEEINKLRQRMEDVQREAMTDALTGIANRKYFDQALRNEAMGAMEKGDPLCLLLTDIDHFKAFNDTYGHQTGDQVLKLVGRTLVENVKGKDTAARYGGEEFAIILPNTQLDEAKSVGETIRRSIETKRIRNRQTGKDMGNITLSIGCALFRQGEPLTEFIQRADEGLYGAKRGGRNQVVTELELDTAKAS